LQIKCNLYCKSLESEQKIWSPAPQVLLWLFCFCGINYISWFFKLFLFEINIFFVLLNFFNVLILKIIFIYFKIKNILNNVNYYKYKYYLENHPFEEYFDNDMIYHVRLILMRKPPSHTQFKERLKFRINLLTDPRCAMLQIKFQVNF
jgi:hypothetical protein